MNGTQDFSVPQNPASAPQSDAKDKYDISKSLVMISDPDGAATEGIRALRTHLMAQHIQLGRRALAICSANPEVGKTFISTNLALAFAQIGIKVMLIEADLQSHAMHDYFPAINISNSLVEYLRNHSATFDQAITPDVYANLSVIFAGNGAASPQELLGGSRFRDLIDFCLRDYELTIVDTPAANRSTDARRISTLVGYSLIIAGRNKSRVSDVQILLDQITGDHGKAIGTVLNNA